MAMSQQPKSRKLGFCGSRPSPSGLCAGRVPCWPGARGRPGVRVDPSASLGRLHVAVSNMCICVYIYIYIYITHMMCRCVCVCVCVCTDMHIQTCVHAVIHAWAQTKAHPDRPTASQRLGQTYMHTHIHAYTHTIHMYGVCVYCGIGLLLFVSKKCRLVFCM